MDKNEEKIITLKSLLKRKLSYFPFFYKITVRGWYIFHGLRNKLLAWFILNIPPVMRISLARLLKFKYPTIVNIFNNVLPNQLGKTVLFVSNNLHSREPRMAEAASLAGWNPIVIYIGKPKYNPDDFFQFHAQVKNTFQMILAIWLFRGSLIHLFTWGGHEGYIVCKVKPCPVILDIYDTFSGLTLVPDKLKDDERNTIRIADGMTHRDLRVKYLHDIHDYKLPKYNVFITDLMPEVREFHILNRMDKEIHAVSTGTLGGLNNPDNMIVRSIESLCKAGIHVHIYCPHNSFSNPDMKDYLQLIHRFSNLHIEPPIFGDAYWEQLRNFDFGLAIFEPLTYSEPPTMYTNDYLKGCGSSRLMDYTQADLGVIISPGLEFMNFLARRYAQVVVPATIEFLNNPRPILEQALIQKKNGVKKNLHSITTKGVAPRLGEFYSKVASINSEQ